MDSPVGGGFGLTSRGRLVTVSAAVLVLTGLALGHVELVVLGTAGASAVLAALGYTARRPRLDVSRHAESPRVGCGAECALTLRIRHAGRLRLARLVATERCAGAGLAVPLPRLGPGAAVEGTYRKVTIRRGVLRFGPLRVVRQDPFGLAALVRDVGPVTEVRVYPTVYPLRAMPAGVTRSHDGRLDRVPQGTITFDTLRAYVVGDELRRVHWRTTARMGALMVRQDVDTSLPRLVVMLDDRRQAWTASPETGAGPSGFEAACAAAASLVVAAAGAGLPVRLVMAGSAGAGTGSATEPASLDGMLDALAEVQPIAPPGALRAAARGLRHRGQGDTLLFLGGSASPDDLAAVASLRGAYPTVIAALFTLDPTGATGASGPAGAAGATAATEDFHAGAATRAPAATGATDSTFAADTTRGEGATGAGGAAGTNLVHPGGIPVLVAVDAPDFVARWDAIAVTS